MCVGLKIKERGLINPIECATMRLADFNWGDLMKSIAN